MSLDKEGYEQLDLLIRLKATGTPQRLADKFNVSKRSIQRKIEKMKDIGCPIYYNRIRRSYCYRYPGKLIIKFEELDNTKLYEIKGGVKNIIAMPNNVTEGLYICNEKLRINFSGFPTPNIKVGFKFI